MSKRWCAVILATALAGGAFVTAGVGHTFASWSDASVFHAEASAATWGPVAPPQCTGMTFDKVIVLTDSDDTWDAASHGLKTKSLLVFGLGGGDVITGGVMDDCLVGGSGDDTLNGAEGKDVLVGDAGDDTLTSDNAKDQLFGGDDDDSLYGGNGKDLLDGGAGTNVCYGGNAPDFVVVPCGGTP